MAIDKKFLDKLLALPIRSFTEQFSKFTDNKSRDVYLRLLTELSHSIEENNLDCFQKYSKYLKTITDTTCIDKLKDLFATDNPFQFSNAIILASKFSAANILQRVLANYNKILDNLAAKLGRSPIRPEDVDEQQHNAIYYAFRSGNVDIAKALIEFWSIASNEMIRVCLYRRNNSNY